MYAGVRIQHDQNISGSEKKKGEDEKKWKNHSHHQA